MDRTTAAREIHSDFQVYLLNPTSIPSSLRKLEALMFCEPRTIIFFFGSFFPLATLFSNGNQISFFAPSLLLGRELGSKSLRREFWFKREARFVPNILILSSAMGKGSSRNDEDSEDQYEVRGV
jgi:hypothetical protein